MFDFIRHAIAIAKSHVNETEEAVIDGIYMWMAIAIVLVVFLPVLNGVHNATALNAAAPLFQYESTLMTMEASSYGLLIVVLIVFAAVIILGVITYLRQR